MNRCEAEIDAIRLELYKETKDLSNDENNRRLSELGKKLSIQFGFKLVESARRTSPQKSNNAQYPQY